MYAKMRRGIAAEPLPQIAYLSRLPHHSPEDSFIPSLYLLYPTSEHFVCVCILNEFGKWCICMYS